MLENNKKIEHLSLIHFDVENEGNLHKDVSNMIKDIKFLTLLRWSKDNLKNIRILKLKNCQLTDEDFQDIDVENYHLLE